jgi:type III restriction enzyme
MSTPTAAELASSPFDVDRVEAIAARLDLRQPNKEALESIVFETAQHYEIDREPPPFEAVVDIATGVGKTYVLAAAIEYMAADGGRNFAVVTPGRTILEKTVANFSPGHRKSLLPGMEVRPVVVTSENFATAAMRAAMDDPEAVKLFIFTVQALTKPQTKVGRRTHKFQEGLGEAFYAHLQGLDDLVVFADEHHTYYGPAFSEAIRDLRPRVLIGLTATPHKRTPADQIIYRYPLAAAIADELVKTPVLVGRKDDRTDLETKLRDGLRLLDLKERSLSRWSEESDAERVNPVMLVIAPKIDEANEIERVLTDPGFEDGRYAGSVLTVHSDAPDEALAALERLEDPTSPYRVVISVGMLKEGWDVKNVYVIASMRASVSELLTEQTLGRGLRLPFGTYTGIELLDTLEVLGHERYEDLLRKAGVLNEQFIDRRTRAVLRRTSDGSLVAVPETTEVAVPVVPVEGALVADAVSPAGTPGTAIASVEEYTANAEEQLLGMQLELAPRSDVAPIVVPRLRMSQIQSAFSLADITDLAPFRGLGRRIGADPAGQLRRVRLGARVIQGPDGLRRTELVTERAVDRVESPASLLPAGVARDQLLDRVLNAPVVPARPTERTAALPIVSAFIEGLGDQADKILSGYMDRAAAGLIELVTEEQRKYAAKPTYAEVVERIPLRPTRLGRPTSTRDRFSAFKRSVGHEGYRKSLFAQDWFDSSTERDVANLLDDSDEIVVWVRLQTGDLPILWTSGGREYNPDFVAIDAAEDHWVIEVKMDKEMASADVVGKRDAARRWANYVNADPSVHKRWHYLLVSESDVSRAKASWEALRKLGGE